MKNRLFFVLTQTAHAVSEVFLVETRNLCQNFPNMLKISFLLLNLMSYLIGSQLGTQVMRQVRSNPDFGQFVGAGAMGGW